MAPRRGIEQSAPPIDASVLQEPPKPQARRLARLDGIRAVAVLCVIFYHHSIGECFGWVGVDLFFVLSGFLITTILVRSSNQEHYWKVFYTKRAARILPPLLLMFAAVLSLEHHLSVIGILGCLLFLGNVIAVSHYSIALLLALWSLAIEEHFYILWPFLTRIASLKTLAIIILFGIFLEPFIRWAAMYSHVSPEAIYYLTPFRLDGLLFGALLAVMGLLGVGKEWISHFGGFSALALWIAIIAVMETIPSFQHMSPALPFNVFGYSIVALASFVSVGYVAWNDQSIASRFLSLRILSFIGEISYGMYLFHPIVIAIARHLLHIPPGQPGQRSLQQLALPDLFATIGLAYLSYKFVETPSMEWGKRRVMRIGAQRENSAPIRGMSR